MEHDASRADTLAANRVPVLFQDRNGLLFAGSWTNGFSVHDPRTQAFGLIDRVADGARTLAVPSTSVSSVAVIGFLASSVMTFFHGTEPQPGILKRNPRPRRCQSPWGMTPERRTLWTTTSPSLACTWPW